MERLLRPMGVDALPASTSAGDRLFSRAADEGIEALLCSEIVVNRLVRSHDRKAWQARLAGITAADAARHAELVRVVEGWTAEGLDALLLKGSGLAYTLYPAPWLRPQSDVDVWCQPSEAPRMRRSLERLGYAEIAGWNNEGKHQFHYLRTDGCGIPRLIEVHLRVANPEAFAHALPFAAARAAAVHVPGVPGGWTLSPPHALLLACVHRAAHHYGSRRLIWLYDIHLLAGGLSGDEWSSFGAAATAGRVAAVCRDGLAAAAASFGTVVPAEADAALATGDEPSRYFLEAPRELDVRLSTLRATPTWQGRARHVRGWLFPPATYMTARYGLRHRWLLPFWYGYRAVTRLPSWWRRYGAR